MSASSLVWNTGIAVLENMDLTSIFSRSPSLELLEVIVKNVLKLFLYASAVFSVNSSLAMLSPSENPPYR